MPHIFIKEQSEFLKENVIGISNMELTEKFNQKFDTNLKVNQITAYKKNHKLRSGMDAKFKAGQPSWNKGKKGTGGWKPTQFKKGNKPHNYLPVGTVRVNGDDYLDIKISDPNKWKAKHILIWEEHNGPVPKGHCIIFGDGNNRNFDLENLLCISRKHLIIMNNKKLIKDDVKLTQIGVLIADISIKANERKAN